MTLPINPNALTVTASQATDMGGSPALGLLDSIHAAFVDQSFVNNPVGFEHAFRNEEDANIAKAREAGFDVPSLDQGTGGWRIRDVAPWYAQTGTYQTYTNFQRAAYEADTFASTSDDESRTQVAMRSHADALVKERNALLVKAKAARPDLGIMTYEEMRTKVTDEGKAAYQRWMGSRSSLASSIGGFIGSMAGELDFRTNPWVGLNFVGGGGGKTAMIRIMRQFGINALPAAVEQLTGARENMRWFGVEPSVAESLLTVGIAGGLGAGLQGLGELARARLAPRPKPAPVPAPAPARAVVPLVEATPAAPIKIDIAEISKSAEKVVLDRISIGAEDRVRNGYYLDHVTRNSDTWGSSPGDMEPPMVPLHTSASVIPDIKSWLGPGVDDMKVTLPRSFVKGASQSDLLISDVARDMDPEVFAKYDKLTKQAKEAQTALERAVRLADERKGIQRSREASDAAIEAKRAQISRARSAASKSRLNQELLDLQALQAAKPGRTVAVPPEFDVERVAKTHADIVTKRSQILPLVEAAVARSQGEWELRVGERARLTDEFRDALTPNRAKALSQKLQRQRREGKLDPRQVILTEGPSHPRELAEIQADIPELRHPAAAVGGTVGEPKIDVVQRVLDAQVKEAEPELEKWQATIAKLFEEPEKGVEIEDIPVLPDGTRISQLADTPIMFGPDGKEMTLREAWADIQADKEAMTQFTSCLLPAGWASAKAALENG